MRTISFLLRDLLKYKGGKHLNSDKEKRAMIHSPEQTPRYAKNYLLRDSLTSDLYKDLYKEF